MNEKSKKRRKVFIVVFIFLFIIACIGFYKMPDSFSRFIPAVDIVSVGVSEMEITAGESPVDNHWLKFEGENVQKIGDILSQYTFQKRVFPPFMDDSVDRKEMWVYFSYKDARDRLCNAHLFVDSRCHIRIYTDGAEEFQVYFVDWFGNQNAKKLYKDFERLYRENQELAVE